MTGNRQGDKQLRTLERWKTLEVEQAQAQHVVEQSKEKERQAAVDDVVARIEQADDLTRTQFDSSQPLSPETLLRLAHYTAVQRDAMHLAEEALREAQTNVEQARSHLLKQTEELFGVERLRERRADEATLDTSRREQRQLDDYALLRLSITAEQKTSRE